MHMEGRPMNEYALLSLWAGVLLNHTHQILMGHESGIYTEL